MEDNLETKILIKGITVKKNELPNHVEDRSEVNRNNERQFRNRNSNQRNDTKKNELPNHVGDRSEVNRNTEKQFRNRNSNQRNDTKKNELPNHVEDRSEVNRYNGRQFRNRNFNQRNNIKKNELPNHVEDRSKNRNVGEMHRDLNPYTNQPYTERYHRLLRVRKKLPVWEDKDKFMEMLGKNKIMIVHGETGSGKTTQIPQWCIEYCNLMEKKLVACIQPRRISAVNLADRVSKEMDVRLGKTVGYSIRFENVTSSDTKLKFVTDGVLLREIIGNSEFHKYGVICLDEAHERSITMDVLMALLKEKVSKDSELRIVIMSATLEAEKFINYFKNAPVLTIPGFTHPVELIYTRTLKRTYAEAVVSKAVEIHRSEITKGDILIFLTGKDVRSHAQISKKNWKKYGAQLGKVDCIPLYSTLSKEAQNRINNQPPKGDGAIGRKIIISTNIAETSLTIDGVTFVIDSGFTKQKSYDPRTRIESLQVTNISKASANQRKGRAGRTAPGKCFRLYTEDNYNKMKENTIPEILRSNLATMVLGLKKLGIHDVVNFDYIDPPDYISIAKAIEILKKLDALDQHGELTNLGALMADFPLEPQLSRMLIHSKEFDCTEQILTIVAMLSGKITCTFLHFKYIYGLGKLVLTPYTLTVVTSPRKVTSRLGEQINSGVETSVVIPARFNKDLELMISNLLHIFTIFPNWCASGVEWASNEERNKEKSNKKKGSRKIKEYREENLFRLREEFSHSNGDHYTLLNIYNEFIEYKQSAEWCKEYCIKYNIMIQAEKARGQLSKIMKNLGLNKSDVKIVYDEDDEETDIDTRIGKTLASGFFLQVAKFKRSEKGRNYYTCNGDLEAQLLECTSCTNTEYVIYNDLIKLNTNFISKVSKIEVCWLPLEWRSFWREKPAEKISRPYKICDNYDISEKKYETNPDEDYGSGATSSSDQLFPE
ncbi:Pre-mRNA-splicing factor ATP-dependent RNA helicase DHX15 [Nymphon striatum]|nr:Pre-mRNA-splicing factor ATP-dependent RNA helicase DHX15 [Nymphon striatum]